MFKLQADDKALHCIPDACHQVALFIYSKACDMEVTLPAEHQRMIAAIIGAMLDTFFNLSRGSPSKLLCTCQPPDFDGLVSGEARGALKY